MSPSNPDPGQPLPEGLAEALDKIAAEIRPGRLTQAEIRQQLRTIFARYGVGQTFAEQAKALATLKDPPWFIRNWGAWVEEGADQPA
jgi:hypothetical protein